MTVTDTAHSDAVLTLSQRWAEAERSGDANALDAILAGNFLGIGPHGFVLDKNSWLERYHAGQLVNDSFSLKETVAQRYGDTADRGPATGPAAGRPAATGRPAHPRPRTVRRRPGRSGGQRRRSAAGRRTAVASERQLLPQRLRPRRPGTAGGPGTGRRRSARGVLRSHRRAAPDTGLAFDSRRSPRHAAPGRVAADTAPSRTRRRARRRRQCDRGARHSRPPTQPQSCRGPVWSLCSRSPCWQ